MSDSAIDVRLPLASEFKHQVSKDYGVFLDGQGHDLRGTFVIGPDGVLRSSAINDLDVGRSVDETSRTFQAFKTGGSCPVGWKPGQATLEPRSLARAWSGRGLVFLCTCSRPAFVESFDE